MDPESGDENEIDDEDNFDEQPPKDYWEEQEMARQITNFKAEGADEEGAKNAELQARAEGDRHASTARGAG